MKSFNNYQFEFRKYQQKQDAKEALKEAKDLEEPTQKTEQMQESIGNEFFPPSEEELKEIIAELKRRLEDESYEEEWVKIHEELMYREKQLKETIKNNEI
ncbi:hypothetical protein LEQ04_09490 [Riemerella anatipestifer]|nr:hypothetical protein LEQ04_09490 [Riemerella anatipestifer]